MNRDDGTLRNRIVAPVTPELIEASRSSGVKQDINTPGDTLRPIPPPSRCNVNTTILRPTTLTLALLLAAAPALAQVPAYDAFQLQARSNLLVNDNGFNLPPGSSFNSVSAVINNDGDVAFPVQVVTTPGDPTDTGAGIWLGRNGIGGIVRRHDPPNDSIGTAVAINNAGKVAYIIHQGGSAYTMWLYDPGSAQSTPVNLLPLTPNSLSNVSLGDGDVLGYQGMFGGSRGFASTVAFASPPDSVAHLYDNNLDPSSEHNYLYSPAMNNQRVIAGKVNTGTGSDFSKAEIRLFAADGSSERVVADVGLDPTSPFNAFDNGLDVNDHGAVAVVARLSTGNVRAVYRFDAGGATEIARIGAGPITGIDFFAPAINNNGLVAFRAVDAGGQAVYVGDGTSLLRVIGKGDVIETDQGTGQLGQHDSSAVFGGAPDINDNGDVVVIAGLHPQGNNQVEWGSGVIVAWAAADDDTIFADGFEDTGPR